MIVACLTNSHHRAAVAQHSTAALTRCVMFENVDDMLDSPHIYACKELVLDLDACGFERSLEVVAAVSDRSETPRLVAVHSDSPQVLSTLARAVSAMTSLNAVYHPWHALSIALGIPAPNAVSATPAILKQTLPHVPFSLHYVWAALVILAERGVANGDMVRAVGSNLAELKRVIHLLGFPSLRRARQELRAVHVLYRLKVLNWPLTEACRYGGWQDYQIESMRKLVQRAEQQISSRNPDGVQLRSILQSMDTDLVPFGSLDNIETLDHPLRPAGT